MATAALWIRRIRLKIGPFIRWLWNRCLLFLEIIGLLPERTSGQEARLATFKLYHAEFRKLLSANNSFLQIIAELEHKLLAKEFVDRAYIERKVVRAVSDVHSMVESLNVISDGRYPAIRTAFERAYERLIPLLGTTPTSSRGELVIDLESLYRRDADLVGAKMANLAEIRNVLGLPTPEGFVVTTEGFRMLMEEAGIRSMIQQTHAEIEGPQDIERVSRVLQELILSAEIPEDLQKAISDAFHRVRMKVGDSMRWAVRSSAIGEDAELSFAGQFLTLRDVTPEGLLDAYLKVVASLFSPGAIHYRLLHGISGESAEMAVGVVAMVDALLSGILFSREPTDPACQHVIIQSVHGVGVSLAEGSVIPTTLTVPRPADVSNGLMVRRASDIQDGDKVACVGDDKVQPVGAGVTGWGAWLSDEEARQLAQWAVRLEKHFGGPQDIEWAMKPDRSFVLLQTRPLHLAQPFKTHRQPVSGYAMLLQGGETACPGVGSGIAFRMDENDDPASFPHGGVLVAKRSSPLFVKVMDKARAIVTDAGSTTGHMASLAREFGIPTLLATGSATAVIPSGVSITVDAGSGLVYEGEVPVSLLASEGSPDYQVNSVFPQQVESASGFVLLQKIVEHMVPLHLTNPRDPGFRADQCMTLHDVTRYIHEKSYEEMFRVGQKLGDLRSSSFRLDVFLPIDLYIVDLGGGVKASVRGRKVKPSHITSVPLSALLKGMLHEKLPRYGPRPIDAGGLFSVMMRHALTDPLQEASFRDPCYALVSEYYLNYTGRVGYHFSVVDTYCCSTPNKNYISILFRGGAADRIRRSRRARAIAAVLKHYGFSAEVTTDVVSARLSKATMEETQHQIEMVGRLFQFFRQMDAAMSSDESIEVVKEAFINEDYELASLKAG